MKSRGTPIWTLACREYAMLFNAPATYVILVLFLVFSGYFFISQLWQSGQSSLDTFVGPLPILLAIVVPALTMRSFAEESREGTIEYLATMPVDDYQIVLGKYLGAMGLVATLMAFTLSYAVILLVIGHPDPGQLVGGYLALLGLSSFYTAIGLWASSLTRNQVVAFIIGFFVCFGFFLIERIAGLFPGMVQTAVRALGIGIHFETPARGVLDSRDILYWLSGTVLFLWAALTVVYSRRWR